VESEDFLGGDIEAEKAIPQAHATSDTGLVECTSEHRRSDPGTVANTTVDPFGLYCFYRLAEGGAAALRGGKNPP